MKRRSQPKRRRSKNTYGKKRAAGAMMYGPSASTPKYPHFPLGRVVVRCDRTGMKYNACGCAAH